jgi:hypothetical protein
MSNIPNYNITSTNNTNGPLVGNLSSLSIGTTATPNSMAALPIISKMPGLSFRLFSAENGYFLEVTDKIIGPANYYSGTVLSDDTKIYVINSIENLGDTISKIISIYLLKK